MTSNLDEQYRMAFKVKMETHLPVGCGPSPEPEPPALTGTLCYHCQVPLTKEYGVRASETARWQSYAATSLECCKKCCRELQRDATQKAMAERSEWPSEAWGRIRYLLLERDWIPGPFTDADGVVTPETRWDFFRDCGRWALQWRKSTWVLCEAPDYDVLVERSEGETVEELLGEMRKWEVGG